jgi:hypothetical protein
VGEAGDEESTARLADVALGDHPFFGISTATPTTTMTTAGRPLAAVDGP